MNSNRDHHLFVGFVPHASFICVIVSCYLIPLFDYLRLMLFLLNFFSLYCFINLIPPLILIHHEEVILQILLQFNLDFILDQIIPVITLMSPLNHPTLIQPLFDQFLPI
jgi:hypothetical protein